MDLSIGEVARRSGPRHPARGEADRLRNPSYSDAAQAGPHREAPPTGVTAC
ncbi:hypothetical protein Slala03_50300 [Streptomyces lavendulae subsp. lavendulae]|nr:hypothetical protein Slala03_50300 [Streptomyces lavendulae subsp. lavendulae]